MLQFVSNIFVLREAFGISGEKKYFFRFRFLLKMTQKQKFDFDKTNLLLTYFRTIPLL